MQMIQGKGDEEYFSTFTQKNRGKNRPPKAAKIDKKERHREMSEIRDFP